MEALQAKHRKEQRDLQSQITQKKKSASKKTRKGVNDECDRLQRELTERQHLELAALDDHVPSDDHGYQNSDSNDVDGELANGKGAGAPETEPIVLLRDEHPNRCIEEPIHAQSRKPNRQKARMARRAAEQEAMVTQAEQEAANVPDAREQERATIQKRFEALSLQEVEVRPDGHCMYSAVARQLGPHLYSGGDIMADQQESYLSVRATTARFIADNPGDFSPFLEETLESYVNKIRETAEWGGQLELQAISQAYQVEINVLQASGEIIKFEPQSSSTKGKIWLAYYRHSFGLGEHYNALIKS